MKILLLCFVGLIVLVVVGALGFFAGVLVTCSSVVGPSSMGDNDYCPEILPRKTGHLSRDQKFFTSGFALGALASVAGAWVILKISL